MAKILISSPNVISTSMAGAAIRAWEFAKALASEHQVTLISSGKTSVKSSEFHITSLDDPSYKNEFRDADILITQRLTGPLSLLTTKHQVKVIIDAYDPSPLELLEQFKMRPQFERNSIHTAEITRILFGFKMAEGILCASEKQREFWLGFFLGQEVLTPALYDRDSSLRNFLAVVPFGLSSTLPEKKGAGLRERFGLASDDKVLLWGGGVWDWFDPLTLIRAMKILSLTRKEVKLVFMGIKPPDLILPRSSMSSAAIQLAEDLGLIHQSVFFNTEWVPYDQRQNFLLDADIGISTHFDHLETRFSFRTRILDYLWAELPIITTEGDSFADIVEKFQLGAVVPYQDPEALARAITDLIDRPEQMGKIKGNLRIVREEFYWSSVLLPLREMIARVLKHPRRRRWRDRTEIMKFFLKRIRQDGFVRYILNKTYRQFHKVGKKFSSFTKKSSAR